MRLKFINYDKHFKNCSFIRQELKVAAWKALAEAVNVVGGHNRTWNECRAKKIKWFSKVKSKVRKDYLSFVLS